MICRQRSVPRRQRGTMQVGELIGMEPDRQAESLGHIEDACGFVDGEGDAFAESVDGISQLFIGNQGQHAAD